MSNVAEFVERYNLVIDAPNTNEEFTYIRSSISSKEEALRFVKKYGQKTNTNWIIYYGRKCHQKVIFHTRWLCHRSNLRKAKLSVRNANCPAKIDIVIKKVNRFNAKSDAYIRVNKPPLPCIIRMHADHSPACYQDAALQLLRVSDEVKEKFFAYFDKGLSVPQARKDNERSLKLQSNQNAIRCTHFNPTQRQANHLYALWRAGRQNRSVSTTEPEPDPEPEDLTTATVEEFFKSIPRKNLPSKKVSRQRRMQSRPKPYVVNSLVKIPANRNSLPTAETSVSSQLQTDMNITSHVNYVSVPQMVFVQQHPQFVTNSFSAVSNTQSSVTPQLPESNIQHISLTNYYPDYSTILPDIDPSSSSTSSSFPAEVTIKEEPPDTYDNAAKEVDLYDSLLTSTNVSNCTLPTVVSVHSLAGNSGSENAVTTMSESAFTTIKVEKEDSNEGKFCKTTMSESAVTTIKVENEDSSEDINDSLKSGKQCEIQSSDPAPKELPSKEDEDMQFLLSLLPELQRLPANLKTHFKTKAMSLLLECRFAATEKRLGRDRPSVFQDSSVLSALRNLK